MFITLHPTNTDAPLIHINSNQIASIEYNIVKLTDGIELHLQVDEANNLAEMLKPVEVTETKPTKADPFAELNAALSRNKSFLARCQANDERAARQPKPQPKPTACKPLGDSFKSMFEDAERRRRMNTHRY